MEDKNNLFKNSPPNYPANKYYDHLLEQYKIYLELADNISNRRQTANSFFLSVNTALITIITYIKFGPNKNLKYFWLISLAGIIICYSWYKLTQSYHLLKINKFKIIHELETKLPASPYDEEWEKVERGDNEELYLSFTKIEIIIPWVFLGIHSFVLLTSIPWAMIISKIQNIL